MAELIRNEHRLLTLRIHLRPGRSGARVLLTGYRGGERLEELEADPGELGIQEVMSPRAYRGVRFQLPDALGEGLADFLHRHHQGDEPLWLQLSPSSGLLAVVPWERLLSERMGVPILRIPNFLVERTPPPRPGVYAVCASSPRAKTPFPVEEQVGVVLDALTEVDPGAEIHLFGDAEAWPRLQGMADRAGAASVVLHAPEGAAELDRGEAGRALDAPPRSGLRSPWLTWMRRELPSRRITAVHFLCPGYFSRSKGALALARSPLDNTDTSWSHFVGAQELETFLRYTGAWALGVTSPYENVWAVGLRLLLEELCWSRPNPLLLHDAEGWALDPEGLAGAYGFLLGDLDVPPPAGTVSLRCHPELARPREMPRQPIEHPEGREEVREEAEAELPREGGLETIQRDPEMDLAMEAEEILEPEPEPAPEPEPVAAEEPPLWLDATLEGLKNVRKKLEGSRSPEGRGRQDAVRFLADLVAEPSETGDATEALRAFLDRRGEGEA